MRSKHQRNSLMIAAVSACLPAAIIGLLVYMLVTDKMEEATGEYRQSQIEFATERIDSNLSHLELAMAQWTFRLPLESSLGKLDVEKDYRDMHSIYSALTWVKSSDQLIEEVTLYLVNQRTIVRDHTGLIKLTDEEEIAKYQALASVKRDLYWTVDSLGNPNAAPSMLVVSLPGGAASLFVQINAKQLDHLISELGPEDNGSVMLLQQEGKPISLGKRSAASPSPLDGKLIAAVQEKEGLSAGAEIKQWDGRTYSVTYGTMKRIGQIWTIAAAAPIEQMTKPVRVLSHIIIATSVFGLLLALFLSWVAYRQIYDPFQRLVQQITGRKGGDALDDISREWWNLSRESQMLQERVDKQLPTLRESFLLQLVQGHLNFLGEQELLERMTQYGWEVQERSYAALIVQVCGLYENDGRFSEGDEQLVTFAAANITQELIQSKGIEASVVNFQDLTVGVLLHDADKNAPSEQLKTGIYRLADELATTLRTLLKVEITVSVGRNSVWLREVPQLFADARGALHRRRLGEPQQIVDVEEWMPSGHEEVCYPFEAEKALLQALRMGMDEQLDGLLQSFFNELKAQATKEIEIRQGLLQLCGNVSNTILQTGFNSFEVSGGAAWWDELADMRSPQSILDWLSNKMIKPYLRKLHRTQDLQLKQLVENVLETIRSGYMNDISLELCADLHGTYPKRLSLGFKQVTGQTFIDYLTQYRLEQAKRLLLETDEAIGDIALQVGYQPPYFNRLFKKNEGLTPGQYRERHEG